MQQSSSYWGLGLGNRQLCGRSAKSRFALVLGFGIDFVGMPRFSERPAQGALRPPTAVLACLLGYLSIEELDDEQQECKAN